MAERRTRSFGPTVLVGLSGAALSAVAAARDWATAPLGIALALVSLAAWGVVLVLRGRLRRVVAVLGALASAGVLAVVVSGFHQAREDAVHAVVAKGGTGQALPSALTGWYFACGVGAVITLLAFAVAVVTAPWWPAMGSRYDAPGTVPGAGTGTGSTTGSAGPATERDMWRALDDGRDPTA
jgi:uncharacterized membrane protein (TIGR02234 family)